MSTSRATLYTFDHSLWASLPDIMLKEKAYSEDDVERKSVNLLKGEQYAPEYLNLNSHGTVPTLVVPLQNKSGGGPTRYQAIAGSIAIIDFLDKSKGRSGLNAVSQGAAEGPSDDYGGPLPSEAELHERVAARARTTSSGGVVLSPATVSAKRESDELIKTLQSADGNFLLFGFVSVQERDHKQKLFRQAFVDRTEALLKFLQETRAQGGPESEQKVAFYERTLETFAPLTTAYEAMPASFSTSQGAEGRHNRETATRLVISGTEAEYEKLRAMFESLESSVKLPYAMGDQFSLADVVAMAVLARVAFIAKMSRAVSSGHDNDDEPLTSFRGLPTSVQVGPKVQSYMKNLTSRQSFKEVYVKGLH